MIIDHIHKTLTLRTNKALQSRKRSIGRRQLTPLAYELLHEGDDDDDAFIEAVEADVARR